MFAVYKTSCDGHIYVFYQQFEKGKNDDQGRCGFSSCIRKVPGRYGSRSQRQTVARQSSHKACPEVP